MLKKEITYTNFDGEEITETLYFNLTKAELFELYAEYSGGLEEIINKMVREKDNQALVKEFKKIILMCYGEKSTDGRHFNKNKEIRENFANSAAYDALFTEFLTNEDVVVEFLNGVIPKDLQGRPDQDKPEPGTGLRTVDLPPPPNI